MLPTTDTTGKQKAKLQISSRAVVKRFLIILIPLAVLLGGIASMFYYSAVGKEKIKFETNELNIVTHQVNMIEREFKAIVSDLMLLSMHYELKEMFTGDTARHKKAVVKEFLTFAKARKIYDQIRLLDEKGMEIIRVNFSNGKPFIVPKNQLQSKAARYYFQESMTRDEGEIYVSQFDLNMEHGEIERPLKPMIRYGTPVFDRHGNKSGILLLNYLGANLLQGFKTAGADSLGQAMLLNSDGFWLNGARSEDEWGFMFEERKNHSYKTAFPEAWRKISVTESGQFYTADGIFTYMTVYPFLAAASRQGDGMHFWKAVSYVPNPVLTAESRKTLDSVISLYAFVMVLFAIGAWFLARAGVINKYAEADRKRALAELADSERYNRMLFEQSPIGLALCRMNGELVDINPAYARIIGRNVEETLPLTYWDITPEKYAEEEQRQLGSINTIGHYGPYEKEYIHKDGHLVPVRLQGLLLEKDGEPMIWSSVEDITERKRAEEKEASLGQILDGSLNEIYIFDADTLRFIQVNRGAMENLSYSIEELQRLTPVDLKPEITHTSFMKLLTPLRNGEKEKIQFNTVHQRKDGSLYPVEVHLQLSTFESAPAFVAIIVDITEREQTEAALRRSQKMEAIGQLSGGIAHDFNNQLGVIIGYLDFLKNHFPEDEKPRQWVDTAIKATLRCMDLTRQLLAFSRRQAKQKTVVNLNTTFKDLDTMIARSVTPEIEVQYYLSDTLWQTEIDPGEFQDVILNLVINAHDAMPGGGKLLIETSNKPLDADYATLNPGVEAGDYVQLMLSDTGTGMDKETLEHIFEPFFTTKPEGTGLGMAMVYGFTKHYGGHIKVYSEPGVGTTIRIYLPRSTASESSIMVNNAHESELPTGSESILIVDDEADLLQLADQYLSDLGYRTHPAENVAQALAILKGDEEFDLLFSDVVMPGGMNGYELAQQATEQRPGLKVLLTSGFTSKTMAHNGLARFSAHLLSKPYRRVDLAQRIRLVLDEEIEI